MSGCTSVPTVGILLQQMRHDDPDYRIVATDDLGKALSDGSIVLKSNETPEVVRVVLELLNDSNGEAQNRAVHCMGALALTLDEDHIKHALDTLCSNVESTSQDREQLRDVSIMALKRIIEQRTRAQKEEDKQKESTAINTEIGNSLVARFVRAINDAKPADDSIRLEALGVLSDVLAAYGHLVPTLHSDTLACLLHQLTYTRSAVRKRAITAMSQVVGAVDEAKFATLVDSLLTGLSAAMDARDWKIAQAYNQCFAVLNREVRAKVGPFIGQIFRAVSVQMAQDDDELRESALQCIDAMATRHATDFQPFLEESTALGLRFIRHDPQICDDDDDEAENMSTDEDSDEEDLDDDDDEYYDDDDMSWKVRRQSARLLATIVRTRPAMLGRHYTTIAPVLVKRLDKEREMTVNLEVFAAFDIFLRLTRTDKSDQMGPSSAMKEDSVDQTPVESLAQLTPVVVKTVCAQMKASKKEVRTMQACFHLLIELSRVRPGFLDEYLDVLVPFICSGLESARGHAVSGSGDVTSGLKIDVLEFMYCLLATNSPAKIQSHAALLVAPVCQCLHDDFYKTVAMAIRVATVLIKCLRPVSVVTGTFGNTFAFAEYVPPLYDAVRVRFEAVDVDQEVKERAIKCTATLVAHMGDVLGPEKIAHVLPTFVARLQNETVRVVTARALAEIAASPVHVDLSAVTVECVSTLGLLLRKESRQLRLACILCLDTLQINNHLNGGGAPAAQALEHVLSECPRVITDTDLQLTEAVLCFVTRVVTARPELAQKMATRIPTQDEEGEGVGTGDGSILVACVRLLSSPLLQGGALNAALSFIALMVRTPTAAVQFEAFYTSLSAQVLATNDTRHAADESSVHISKQSFASTSKALAVLVVCSEGKVTPTVDHLLQQIESATDSDSVKLLALLTLGEIGCKSDLFLHDGVEHALQTAFNHPSEDIKLGAAHALGLMSIGNRNDFVTYIMSEIVSKPKRQYLLLNSLKEIIQYESQNPERVAEFKPMVPRLWSLLFDQCALSEEGMRGVVADCAGKLTVIDPHNCLPMLIERLQSPDATVRCAVITAVKYTIADTPQPIDALLRPLMPQFMSHIEDSDLHVRRVSLVTLNSAAHNKPSLISDQLDTLLPLLYQEAVVKPELIRTVQMGPFKHKFDDGLDIRKAAFECMYTLLDWCVTKTDMEPFINQVSAGLGDHYDIKIYAHLMLVRLCALTPSTVVQQLDGIIARIAKTVKTKVKAEAVKQEIEKNDEMIRSALRAVYALSKIPDAESNTGFVQLLEYVNKTHASKYAPIVKEQENRLSTHDPMDTS